MTKRELIDEITHLNPSAPPAFLAEFESEDLAQYLQRLRYVLTPPPRPDVPRTDEQPRFTETDARRSASSPSRESRPEPALS